MLATLASVDQTNGGLLSVLIAERTMAIGSYHSPMIVRRPSGFIEPCQPSKVARPPSGPLWVHEIKHDGYRLMVRRDGLARPLLHAQRLRLGRPLPGNR